MVISFIGNVKEIVASNEDDVDPIDGIKTEIEGEIGADNSTGLVDVQQKVLVLILKVVTKINDVDEVEID